MSLCDHNCGQIEQGAHYIRKCLIYSTRIVFLESSGSINLTKSHTANVCKVSQSLKYDQNFFVHKHIYAYIWTPTPITYPAHAARAG